MVKPKDIGIAIFAVPVIYGVAVLFGIVGAGIIVGEGMKKILQAIF